VFTNADIKIFLFGIFSFLLFIGCSSKKSTPATRTYHQFVTRYNVFFNAQQLYNEALKNQSERFRDNYSEMLPIYPFTRITEKTRRGGAFDGVIEKMEKAIRNHSISPNGDEENNPFMHNVWLLLGKAHAQNQDYNEALSTFSRTVQLFRNDIDVVSEAQLWKIRAYIETNRLNDADSLMNILKTRDLTKRLEPFFVETSAYFLLHQNEYAEAIPYLQRLINFQRNNIQRRRLQFLLGQTFVMIGENDAAFRAFESVKRLRTPFDLLLNAVIQQSAIASGKDEIRILNELQRMSRKANSMEHLAKINFIIGNADDAGFYFFNPQQVQQGKMEFRQRWGNRELEDNWRISNREIQMEITE
jgi:tetratricopeptide (TPR) repeat protein